MNPPLEANIATWRNTIYAHMLRTRGAKYRWFLRYLKLFRLIAKTPDRADFLETYYTLMRFLDDIVDNDAPLPTGYADAESYLLDKIRFAHNPAAPADDVDALMRHCFQLGKSFNESFHKETEDILGSLLFDSRRIGKRQIFTNRELMAHYHRLDISGTVRATMKLFNEDAEKYLLLEPLGMASRFYYDIRDFRDDIRKGFVNISAEDMEAFHISMSDLDDEKSRAVRFWFRAQALRGMALLEQHKKNVAISGFRWSTRLTFPLVYGQPARRFFVKVLQATKDLGAFYLPAMTVGNIQLEEAPIN